MAPNEIVMGSYDLKQVEFVIDSHDISGYEEDGGLEWESGSDIAMPRVGATGSAVASRSNNHSGILTVTVGEWTRAYATLAELMQTQQNLVGPYLPLNFLLRDPMNGDEFVDEWVIFTQRPTPNKALEAGERTFALFMPNVFDPKVSKWGVTNLTT